MITTEQANTSNNTLHIHNNKKGRGVPIYSIPDSSCSLTHSTKSKHTTKPQSMITNL